MTNLTKYMYQEKIPQNMIWAEGLNQSYATTCTKNISKLCRKSEPQIVLYISGLNIDSFNSEHYI